MLSVFFISLMPLPTPNLEPAFYLSDKALHLFTYGFLALWFMQILKPDHFLRAFQSLLAMGVLIELLQALTTYRFFEWWDIIANSAGLILAMTLQKTSLVLILEKIDQYWWKKV